MYNINVDDFINLTKEEYMVLRGVTKEAKLENKWENIQLRKKIKSRDFSWKYEISDILVTLEDKLIEDAKDKDLNSKDLLSLVSFLEELDFYTEDKKWSLYLKSHNFLVKGSLIVNLLKEDLQLRHIRMEEGLSVDIIPNDSIVVQQLLNQRINISTIPNKKNHIRNTHKTIDLFKNNKRG